VTKRSNSEMQKYKHMYGAEAAIWERWLSRNKNRFQRFVYDVHVGRLYPEHETLEGNWRKGAESVYQKRIDAIGYQAGLITIFEVKPHAGLGAVGQIIGYLSLYEDGFQPAEEVVGAIITEIVDPNVRSILEEHNIEVYVV